jgi:HEAT repeat protein
VARALGEFKDGRAAERLSAYLNDDESYFVAAEAALALGKTRSPIAFEAMEKALARESHNDVIRSHVFHGFCELRDMRALEVMREWTAYGRSQQARYAAIATLGRLAHESTEDKDKTTARETIEPCLEGDFRTCLSAISGLQALQDKKAIPALAKLARTTHDSRLKKRAKGAIDAIRAAQGSDKEVKGLRDDYEKLKDNYEKLKERLDKIEDLEKEGKKRRKVNTSALKKTEKMTTRVAKKRKSSKKVSGRKTKAVKKAPSKKKPTEKKKAAPKAKRKPAARKKAPVSQAKTTKRKAAPRKKTAPKRKARKK